MLQDGAGDSGGKGFEFVKSAAGSDTGFFEERRVEDEGAAIHEGMVGGFEGLAEAASGSVAGQKFFVELQIGLKIESVSGGPFLLFGKGSQEFAAEEGGIFAQHRFGFTAANRQGFGAGDFERAGGEGESGFPVEQREQVAIKSRMDLKGVAAVFDDVGIDEAGDDALAVESVGEA